MFERNLGFILSAIPKELHAVAYIAGGAAIAPHTAEDIDVFVLADDDEAVYNTLLAHLNTIDGKTALVDPFPIDMVEKWCEEQGYDDRECQNYIRAAASRSGMIGNGDGMPGIKLVANVVPYGGLKRVQILVSTADSITGLLNSFDLSAHAFAISVANPNEAFAHEQATLPSQLPRIMNVHGATLTLKRLIKVSQRYGWDVTQNPDIPRLREQARITGEAHTFAIALHNANHLSDEDIPF